MTALVQRLRRGSARPRLPGISAILVKDLRGRMRGRRAFIVLTLYLLLLAGIGWMIERLTEQSIAINNCIGCGQSTFGSASIGQGVFVGILMLQTLTVLVLAPASTAGAISGEREHQTLDLLAVTPISSLAIVLGKLLSALAWVFILVLASIPITGLVFLYGGVAPDDLVRGYVVVLASAVGLGSIGLFFSAVFKRTGASTGVTYVAVLVLVLGSMFLWGWSYGTHRDDNGVGIPPPEAILWLNPFVAQADVACGTEGTSGSWCSAISTITGDRSFQNGVTGVVGGPVAVPVVIGPDGNPVPIGKFGGGVAVPDQPAAAVDSLRDRFWPKTVVLYLLLAAGLTLATVQLVMPTRRLHLPRRRGKVAVAGVPAAGAAAGTATVDSGATEASAGTEPSPTEASGSVEATA